jgi:hypothetical protein
MKKPLKVVMTEYINDKNEWEWFEITRGETPEQAIIRYCLDVDEDKPNVKKVKSYDVPCEDGEYWIAENVDVRSYYITIK